MHSVREGFRRVHPGALDTGSLRSFRFTRGFTYSCMIPSKSTLTLLVHTQKLPRHRVGSLLSKDASHHHRDISRESPPDQQTKFLTRHACIQCLHRSNHQDPSEKKKLSRQLFSYLLLSQSSSSSGTNRNQSSTSRKNQGPRASFISIFLRRAAAEDPRHIREQRSRWEREIMLSS